MEGCYIPFDWRKDFDSAYLAHIRFLCLAMTDDYIDAHFKAIKNYASEVECRGDDSACTIDRVRAENRAYREGCARAGEQPVLIDSDYEQTISSLLE